MWLMNAFVALFVSVLLYCGITFIEDMIEWRMEPTNGIFLFVVLYVLTYKGANYMTRGF